jgi:F420-dependent oxidoreductase-like protein
VTDGAGDGAGDGAAGVVTDGRPAFGFQIPDFRSIVGDDPRSTLSRLRDVAAAVEDNGFRSLWIMDHFLQVAMMGGPASPLPEALTTLAALATCTERLQLGVLVSGVTFRNPALLAKQVTTVDVLSGGRAVLGIGAAWFEGEHRAYGWPFPAAAERLDRLEEAVQVCRLMFTEEAPSFDGRWYSLAQAWNSPRPIRSDGIPIMIGGGGERRTLRIVARHADISNVAGNPEVVAKKLALLDGYCTEIGRDPRAIHRTCLTTMRVCASEAETEDTKAALVREGWPAGMAIAGPPDVIAAEAAALHAAGVDEVIANLPGETTPAAVAALGAALSGGR